MITHTIESCWIPSKKDKVKLTSLKNLPKFHFFILKQTLHATIMRRVYTYILKLLGKMWKYGIDPTSIVEDTERTRFCAQTDRRTRWSQNTPLSTSLKRGYKNDGHQSSFLTTLCELNSPDTLRWQTNKQKAIINIGVPHGSNLGPLPFIIYMNDIHMTSNKLNAILYADDRNVISPLCSFNSPLPI